jgi:hypothetical protein
MLLSGLRLRQKHNKCIATRSDDPRGTIGRFGIPLDRSHLMNIFSLSHLLELVKELPDPKQFINANRGRSSVIRLPVRDWDAVRDADHPDREFEAHENPYVEFEIIQWKNTKGVSAPRWVLRGLVAM